MQQHTVNPDDRALARFGKKPLSMSLRAQAAGVGLPGGAYDIILYCRDILALGWLPFASAFTCWPARQMGFSSLLRSHQISCPAGTGQPCLQPSEVPSARAPPSSTFL